MSCLSIVENHRSRVTTVLEIFVLHTHSLYILTSAIGIYQDRTSRLDLDFDLSTIADPESFPKGCGTVRNFFREGTECKKIHF
jgi:hypothetical protein